MEQLAYGKPQQQQPEQQQQQYRVSLCFPLNRVTQKPGACFLRKAAVAKSEDARQVPGCFQPNIKRLIGCGRYVLKLPMSSIGWANLDKASYPIKDWRKGEPTDQSAVELNYETGKVIVGTFANLDSESIPRFWFKVTAHPVGEKHVKSA